MFHVGQKLVEKKKKNHNNYLVVTAIKVKILDPIFFSAAKQKKEFHAEISRPFKVKNSALYC